jgi:hypothetical protein
MWALPPRYYRCYGTDHHPEPPADEHYRKAL